MDGRNGEKNISVGGQEEEYDDNDGYDYDTTNTTRRHHQPYGVSILNTIFCLRVINKFWS